MKRRLKKVWLWIDDRSGITELLKPLLEHPVPPGSKWSYVFGSATLFCFVLQVITGVALALLYQPSSDQAYASLQFITNEAVMGSWLRGLHYFGASGMILMAGVHMLRVYITAAYKYPREMSWISGVILLLLTISMGFTGQLLRWDFNGVWSGVVAAEQMGRIPFLGKFLARLLIGGDTFGGQSLSRFFAYHVFVIPGMLMLLVGFHLWLVLRNGISEPAKAGRLVDPKTYRKWYQNMLKTEGIPFWPYAAWRDVLFSVGIVLLIVVAAFVIGAPELTQPPDPSLVYATPSPDWYLLWLYALFALMPPAIELYVIFLGPLLAMGVLLSLPFLSNKGERSPLKRPWAIVGSIAVVVIITTLLIIGKSAPWSPKFSMRQLPASAVHSTNATVLAGSKVFTGKGCLYCHMIEGEGGLHGPNLTHVARRLTEDELKIRIINGGRDMPAYAQSLQSYELEQLVAFLKTRK